MGLSVNELRIGNYVRCKIYNGNTDVIIPFTWQEVKYLHVFEPIILTPEILEKCGYEWEDIVTKSDGGTEKALVKGFVMMLPTVSGTWYAAPFGYPLHPMRTIFLHQLQNLFFALCGEELNYKP
jgi:hypothetical protein